MKRQANLKQRIGNCVLQWIFMCNLFEDFVASHNGLKGYGKVKLLQPIYYPQHGGH